MYFSTTLPKLLATVIPLYKSGLSNGVSLPLCTGVITSCLNRFGISQVFIILLASFVTYSLKAWPPNFKCSVCRPRISAAFPRFYCLITVIRDVNCVIIFFILLFYQNLVQFNNWRIFFIIQVVESLRVSDALKLHWPYLTYFRVTSKLSILNMKRGQIYHLAFDYL